MHKALKQANTLVQFCNLLLLQNQSVLQEEALLYS